jgi:hypothetical protein
MNRLFMLTALSLFLVLDASHAQTSLHKQRVDEQIDETPCASANWLSRTAQLAERPRVTFAKLFPGRLRYAATVHD